MSRLFYLTAFLLGMVSMTFAQSVTLPPGGDNQKSVAIQYIGSLAHVTVTYNSPNVTAPNGEDRTGKIWGQLVPYGLTDLGFGLRNPAPWRAGANENTTFEFSHDVTIQGRPLKAGKYGFHVIVEEQGPWTLIFSNNSTAWGSFFYDPAEDALRVEASPEKSEFHEWLTYTFTDRQPNACTVALMWENIKLPFRVELANTTQLYVDNLKRELQSSAGFNWQNWNAAANYLLTAGGDLEQALAWAENAVAMPFIGQENFATLSTKAQILDRLNRSAEAEQIMEKAIRHPSANPGLIHQYGRQLLTAGKKEAAMKVFQYNYDNAKGAWPTEVGMARGLSAIGKYKEALPHAEKALTQAPDALNKNSLTQMIANLKAGKDVN